MTLRRPCHIVLHHALFHSFGVHVSITSKWALINSCLLIKLARDNPVIQYISDIYLYM